MNAVDYLLIKPCDRRQADYLIAKKSLQEERCNGCKTRDCENCDIHQLKKRLVWENF